MARNKQIAIILADMLQFYGLDCLLKEYFSPLFSQYAGIGREAAGLVRFLFHGC